MIEVGDPRLFTDALRLIEQHKANVGAPFRGRFVQLFLGLKFFQNVIPSIYSGSFVGTEVLQALLDDLFSKASLPANQGVLSLFENNFLARTGLVGVGNSSPQNTWRNNFNLQKGIGCYATVADLSSPTFLAEDRRLCRHLQVATPGQLAGAHCAFCVTGATYRSESHKKWLRIDPGGAGYAVVDLQNVVNFLPYVAPNGLRIPLAPLVVALYHDAVPGLVLAGRTAVTISDFASDFNFSMAEVAAYFDVSPSNPLNAALTGSSGWSSSSNLYSFAASAGSFSMGPAAVPTGFSSPASVASVAPSHPVLGGTPAPPPMVNTGWDAEQYVSAVLAAAGWNVHDVSRQSLGYDLYVQRGTQRRFIEVKSSVGACSPVLTAREWQHARASGPSYILAILENFNASSSNVVHWVPDPVGNCVANAQSSVSFAVPRFSWIRATVPVGTI